MKIYDISPLLHAGVAVWPGDTRFSRHVSLRLSAGDSVELSDVRMSLHTGTHADAPAHFRRGGATVEQLELEPYWGPARVFTVPGSGEILPGQLEEALREDLQRLLLRAHPGFDPDRFPDQIRSLHPDAARAVAAVGVRLLGVDAPSVDPLDSKGLPAHHELERGGIAILENLCLQGVPDGIYELAALPLRVADGDAAPVRAALRELGEAQ